MGSREKNQSSKPNFVLEPSAAGISRVYFQRKAFPTSNIIDDNQMAYEQAMQIVFNDVEWTVVENSRNEVTTLGPFADWKTAILASEEYCRQRG